MGFGGWVYGLNLCRLLILLETIIHFNAGVTTTSASGRCMEFFFWLVMVRAMAITDLVFF